MLPLPILPDVPSTTCRSSFPLVCATGLYSGGLCVRHFLQALIFLVFFARIKRLTVGQEAADASIKQTHFVLVIPAHNEGRFLPNLLASIQRLNYPATQFKTLVIADNCTDNTASLARQAGVLCFERFTAGNALR
ncbi:MAG: hypothetical protein WKG07_33770 [Hymenobacter sp.]